MPVDTGKPVPFVNVTDVGVPRLGVVNVGDVDSTTFPDPVEATNEYDPAPVRDTKPIPENPVMLSSATPLAMAELVPPFETVKGFCSVRLLNVGDG